MYRNVFVKGRLLLSLLILLRYRCFIAISYNEQDEAIFS